MENGGDRRDSDSIEGMPPQTPNEMFGDLPSREYSRSDIGAHISRQRLTQRRKGSMPSADGISQSDGYGTYQDNGAVEMVDLEDAMDAESEDRNKELIKSMPAPLAKRRSIKKIHELDRENRVKRLSCWKQFKLRSAMGWTLFKTRTKEFFSSLELWRSPFKDIEGNFGNGVLSYFLFLKSLFILNIIIFLLVFSFETIPQIIFQYDILRIFLPSSGKSTMPNGSTNSSMINNSTSNGTVAAFKGCPSYGGITGRSTADHILDFFTGQGYVNTTLMFYSNYGNKLLIGSDGLFYNMPLAYLLVGGGYFIASLLHMVKNLATGFTESVIESGGLFYSFCNKVFASWDYCIINERAATLKCKSIYQDLEAELAEEKRRQKLRDRTRLQRCKIYLVRTMVSLAVIVLLGASIYGVIKAVEVSTNPTYSRQGNDLVTVLARWAPSLTITTLNVILPPVFDILTMLEDWSPKVEVAMSLWRAVLLKLASIAVLVITLYTTFKEHQCQQCWENLIGSQMFNLIWVDFFAIVGSTILIETGRKIVSKYVDCGCGLGQKIGMQEFDIPKNVLDLVYGQALIWIGTFFCPLITVIGVLKLFFLFYVKKISLMKNCKQSSKPYQGARSNYFFTLLLLLTFLLCVVGVGWGITRVKPSCCGPFSNTNCDDDKRMLQVVSDTIKKWPNWIREVINFLQTPAFIAPVFMIICLILYYFRSMTVAHGKMIEMLKDQLVMEGRDKRFLMERLLAYGNTQKSNEPGITIVRH